MFVYTSIAEMGSVAAERRRPTPIQTPEERDVWRDGGRAGWRDGGREGWREGRESSVVQSYSFDSYQLEEEEISKDAPERGVLALSEPGEGVSILTIMVLCVLVLEIDRQRSREMYQQQQFIKVEKRRPHKYLTNTRQRAIYSIIRESTNEYI